jgi:hypothetical protein
MEKAVERSCEQGSMERIWMVRNFKTIYKGEETVEKKKGGGSKEKRSTTPPPPNTKMSTPITPPDRILEYI